MNKENQKDKASKVRGHRIYYVRYADSFMIGINGPKRIANELKKELGGLINGKLILRTKGALARSRKEEKAIFLGTEIERTPVSFHSIPFDYITHMISVHGFRTHMMSDISGPTWQVSVSLLNSYSNSPARNNGVLLLKTIPPALGTLLSQGGRILSQSSDTRIPGGRTRLKMPVKRIVEKLRDQGFCEIKDYNLGEINPKGKVEWINLSIKDIVLKYNRTMEGIRNYYSFAENRARLQLIQYILEHSCAKLIALKMNMNSRKKVFKKYGKTIRITEGQSQKNKEQT